MAQNLSTFSKHFRSMLFVHVCWQAPVFLTDLQKQTHSLPAGYAAVAVGIEVSCNEALQERRNENNIEAFLKTAGSFQIYIHIKTTALHFNFETCSAQLIQLSISILENVFVVVSFDNVTIATNNSILWRKYEARGDRTPVYQSNPRYDYDVSYNLTADKSKR